jgi:hypothetical protein
MRVEPSFTTYPSRDVYKGRLVVPNLGIQFVAGLNEGNFRQFEIFVGSDFYGPGEGQESGEEKKKDKERRENN